MKSVPHLPLLSINQSPPLALNYSFPSHLLSASFPFPSSHFLYSQFFLTLSSFFSLFSLPLSLSPSYPTPSFSYSLLPIDSPHSLMRSKVSINMLSGSSVKHLMLFLAPLQRIQEAIPLPPCTHYTDLISLLAPVIIFLTFSHFEPCELPFCFVCLFVRFIYSYFIVFYLIPPYLITRVQDLQY